MGKKFSLPLGGMALLILVVASCNNAGNSAEASKTDNTERADTTRASGPVAAAAIAPGTASGAPADAAGGATNGPAGLPPIPGVLTPQGLMLQKEATVDLSVADLGKTTRSVRYWLDADGGYYSDWTEQQEDDRLELSLTARVPVEHFEAFKDSMETLGMLQDETASMTDISDAYYAALGRQALAERRTAQYDRVAGKAARSKDELAALDASGDQATQAGAATQDIGQTRRHLAMSTVHLKAFQLLPPPKFGRHLWDNLGEGWRGLEVVILFFAPIWPWLFIVFTVFGAVRFFRAAPKL